MKGVRPVPGHSVSPPCATVPRLCRLSGYWLSRRGSVSVEFALASPILLILLGTMVDFGMLLRVQAAVASGLLNATQYAAVQGPSVTAANLKSVTQLAAPLTGMTASVAGPACYCASAYPVTLTAATCGKYPRANSSPVSVTARPMWLASP